MPSISQVIQSKTFSQAKIVYGDSFLHRKIDSVVSLEESGVGLNELLVLNKKNINSHGLEPKSSKIGHLACVVVVLPRPKTLRKNSQKAKHPAKTIKESVSNFVAEYKENDILKVCRKAEIPLVMLFVSKSFDAVFAQIKQDYEGLIDSNCKRDIHNLVFNTVLEYGIDGLVRLVSNQLRRPACVETVDFNVVSSVNMKGTPIKERKSLLFKCQKIEEEQIDNDSGVSSIGVGKRLVVPLVQGTNSIVGFFSVMTRANDQESELLRILKPASLAAMVVIVQRKRGTKGTSSANISLLKELLLGRNLKSVELEKVEMYFGFDLYDGFYLLGVNAVNEKTGQVPKVLNWPDEIYVSVNVEDTRVFVIPYLSKSKMSYKEASRKLCDAIKSRNKDIVVQIGVSRAVDSMLEFSEAYKQARQSLIIGSMIESGMEYSIGYGDLGLMKLLYLIVDHPELEQFYRETLGPLESYDEEWDTDLTESLRIYVNNGANLNSAARELFIHRHTLRYRLEQIEDDILHIDVDSQEVLLNLQVAFLIKKLLHSA